MDFAGAGGVDVGGFDLMSWYVDSSLALNEFFLPSIYWHRDQMACQTLALSRHSRITSPMS